MAFCLLFTSQAYSQKKGKRKKKDKPKSYLNIQGGLLSSKTFDQNYTGFNLVNLGFSKIKKNKQQSLQLELIGYKVNDIITRTTTSLDSTFIIEEILQGSNNKRRSIELLYNYSFGLTDDITDGFFMGPSASLIYNSNQTSPGSTAQFPIRENCLCLGIGMNTGYNVTLNKNLMLTISSRVTLLDIGWGTTQILNPGFTTSQQRTNKFQTDFLRNQFQLNIGLNFKI